MTKEALKFPAHIVRDETKRWARELFNEFDLSDALGRQLLVTACEAHQRMRGAAEQLDKSGLLIKDRQNRLTKISPLVAVERDSRAALIQSLRAMNIDPGLAPAKR